MFYFVSGWILGTFIPDIKKHETTASSIFKQLDEK